MDSKTIFSKTAKGVREASGASSDLPRALRAILKEIDGKRTFADLQGTLRKYSEAELIEALHGLFEKGYIRDTNPDSKLGAAPAKPVSTPPSPEKDVADAGEDLDFTALTSPAPPPSGKAVEQEALAKAAAKEAAETKARLDAEQKAKLDAQIKARQAALEKAKQEAEAKVRAEAEARLRKEAEERARKEAEAKEKREAEERMRRELEEKLRKETEEKIRHELEEKLKKEAAQKARFEAEERAKREAEEKTRREAEDQARKEAEARERQEAEERMRRELEEKLRKEAEEKAKREAEEKARREAEELARRELEEQLRKEAEEKARIESEERAKQEAEEKARRESEERAKREAEAREKHEAEETQRRELEEKLRQEAEEKTRAEAEEKARQEAEDRARREAEDAAKREAEQKAQRERDERQRKEAEEKARQETERKQREAAESTRLEAEALASKQAEEKARLETEERDKKEAAAEKTQTAVSGRSEAEERLEREAEEWAKREAEENARHEAEEKARKEAEQKAKIEAEEKARRETEERARREAEERTKQEREEKARRAAEEQAREEAELKASLAAREKARREADERARRETEEEARNDSRENVRGKAEDAAVEKASVSASPARQLKLGKLIAIASFVLVVLGIGLLHVMSFDGRIPQFEKAAAEQFRQPIKIETIHFSLFPPHWRIEGVTIGNDGQIKAPQMNAAIVIGSLFGGGPEFKSVTLDSPVIRQEALGWLLLGKPQGQGVKLGRVRASNVLLESPSIDLPRFNADAVVAADGRWQKVVLDFPDSNVYVELQPRGERVGFDLRASTFLPPFGGTFLFEDFSAKGTFDANGMEVDEYQGRNFGGGFSGQASLKWTVGWSIEGTVIAKQVDAKKLVPDLFGSGRVDGKARFAMQSANAKSLFAIPHLDGNFVIGEGALAGVDLTHLIQRSGDSGKTGFLELSGSFVRDGTIAKLQQIRLDAGILSVSGTAEVDGSENIRGRFATLYKFDNQQSRGSLVLSGTLKTPRFSR